MHITLTYEGKLWGNSRKISDVSNIRKYFSDQLEKLSNTEQFDYVKIIVIRIQVHPQYT